MPDELQVASTGSAADGAPEPHPFYALPNHIEDEREYSPSVAAALVGWIFIVAVVGGGLALWGMT